MSTIQLSSTYANLIIINGNGAMAVTNSNTSFNIISGGAATTISSLFIYKGSVPTWATLTDRSTRASDLLISFTLPPAAAGWSYVGNVNQSARYLFGKCATPTTASASGVATWFILCRSGTTSMTDKGAMMGSVGIVGAGADLSVPDINIVTGQNYQSAGFFVNLPQVWTV